MRKVLSALTVIREILSAVRIASIAVAIFAMVTSPSFAVDNIGLWDALDRLELALDEVEAAEPEEFLAHLHAPGGTIDSEPIRTRILSLLKSEDWWVRKGVLRLLDHGGYTDREIGQAVEGLYERDSEVAVHAAALRASCRKRTPVESAVPKIKMAFEYGIPIVVDAAFNVMESRRPDFFVEYLEIIFLEQNLDDVAIRRRVMAYLMETGTRLYAKAFPLALRVARFQDKRWFLEYLSEQTIMEKQVSVKVLLESTTPAAQQTAIARWGKEVLDLLAKLPRQGGKPIQRKGWKKGPAAICAKEVSLEWMRKRQR